MFQIAIFIISTDTTIPYYYSRVPGGCWLQDWFRAGELCESPGGRPGLPASNMLYDFCGRKATVNQQDNLT